MSRPFLLRYENASGATVNLDSWPFFWDDTNLQDYAWDSLTSPNQIGYGSRILGFARKTTTKTIKVLVWNSGNDITSLIDSITAVFESDVIQNTPGKLYFNSQYLPGFFTGVSVNERRLKNYIEMSLSFVSGSPFWITEELHRFDPLTEGISTGFILPLALPFAIVSPNARQLVNSHYAASQAIISMYGPCIDPEFSVGTHTYAVTGTLILGERIEINQVSRTVEKITTSGERLNFFKYRGKVDSVFEPIPSGESYVYSSNDFTFDILLMKERSEPLWS